MTNAALYTHLDGFDTTGPGVIGRQSAGEGFLRGFLRHADVETFYLWHAGGAPLATLEAMLRRLEPTDKPLHWFMTDERAGLASVGVAHLPGPNLDTEAWARRPYGGASYAISGITHTTATSRTMDNIANFLLAPVEGHDALICTSEAVRASVEAQLEGMRAYMSEAYGGPRRRPEPLRAVIPLGVNAEDFAPSADQRQAWRERLEIPADAVVALYVGRFSAREKMNPALMALALERAAKATPTPIYWVNSGWATSSAEADAYHEASRALCPSIHYRVVDGRPADVRFSIWSVADLFISFPDNIQETFGLTPIEAMAAGLPCVVTDWDGYRDTVRHGEDGFRIPTVAPAPGEGFDLAYRHARGLIGYADYVGSAAQFTAIDYAASTEAICALVENADLRARLGANAQARARQIFDWAAIVPQYQALWAEQNARRLAAGRLAPAYDNPFRPDPFGLFAGYPTRHLARDWRVVLSPDMDWTAAQAALRGPLATLGDVNRPSLRECETIIAWLSARADGAVTEVLELFPAGRRSAIARGLLWIARYGVIALRPPA